MITLHFICTYLVDAVLPTHPVFSVSVLVAFHKGSCYQRLGLDTLNTNHKD